MELLELSGEDVKREAKRLAEKIERDQRPDLIVFVSMGAYSIGMCLSEYFGVPLFEIFAVRKSSRIKKLAAPVLRALPPGLKKYLREKEIKSGAHVKSAERKVSWGYIPAAYESADFDRILLVDDSCDTGNTFLQCANKIKERFPRAQVRTAAFNVFTASEPVIRTDYFLYKDHALSGPWSNDSREHTGFIREYNKIFKRLEE